MDRSGYETIIIRWEGRPIEVSFAENWLKTGHWHLELRSDEPLPVTRAGYRSAFLPADTFTDRKQIEAYVIAWLNKAAADPAWLQFLDESRQFKLF